MDETALRRLAEIGVDVYLPRRAGAGAKDAAAPRESVQAPHAASGIVLIADSASARAESLLASIARALAPARIACRRIDAADEAALATAEVLVAFGEARARAAGRLLSAQRQQEIGWVVTADAGELAGDARAKRALWSELKRVIGPLRARSG